MSMQTPKVLGGIDFGLMDPETYRDMSATKVSPPTRTTTTATRSTWG